MSDVYGLSGGEARSPISVSITSGSTDALERAKNMLAGIDKGFRNALGAAIRRTGASTRAFIAKEIRQEYYVKASDLKKHTSIHVKPDVGNGFARVEIRFTGTHIPLLEFDTHIDRSGKVSTRVKRNSSRSTLEDAFLQTMPTTGHRGIFERVTEDRTPIREFFGPSIPQMLSYNTDLQDKIAEHAQETFEKRLDHEVSAVLNGWR